MRPSTDRITGSTAHRRTGSVSNRTTLRPCPHQPCAELTTSGPCARHRAHRAAVQREREGSAAARGYDRDWRVTRSLLLATEPLCRTCRFASGRLKVAAEVDHIIPLSAGGERLQRDNLQPLCLEDHQRKSAAEWAAARARERQLRQWIHLICGPPRSGKSTLIEQRRRPGDFLIDYDEIMRAVTGLPLHQHPHSEPAAQVAHWLAYDALLAMLSRLTRLQDPGCDVWVATAMLSSDRARQLGDHLGAEVVELQASPLLSA